MTDPEVRTGRRWTLRRRLTITFVVLSVLAITGTALAVTAVARVDEAQHRQVDRLDPAIQAGADLLVALLNQETGLRGYALTRDAEFLQPFAQGQAAVKTDLDRLSARIGDDATLRSLFTDLSIRARAWQQDYAAVAIETVRDTPLERLPAVPFDRGKGLFDRIREAYDALQQQLVTDRKEARDQLGTATQWLIVLVASAAALVASSMVLIWIFLQRWVTRPLEVLGREVRTVAGGDLEHEVHVRGPLDITAVADDAELMRRQIVDEYLTAVAARREAQAAEEQTLLNAEELRRSNAELEQFAYIASHDLQEPLRKVASFCQMLQRRYAGQLDERADKYIDFAVDGAKRMQDLINDLLALSRVGRTNAGFKPVDLNVCVATAISDLEARLTETGARVEVGALAEVPGDTSLLRQLFINLIGNAVKFRGPQPPRVHISGAADPGSDGELFVVTVADNGIGIDPRYAEKVFAIFSRLHAREEFEGTGIGLALCRKIVEFHGGSIEVVPPTGRDSSDASDGATGAPTDLGGATLRFTLPVRHSAVPAPLSAAARPPAEPAAIGDA